MRKLFYDIHLQRRFERQGFVVVNLLDAQTVSSLIKLHNELSPEMEENFYTSIWSTDKAYRQQVDRELKQVLPKALEKFLIDCKPVFANFMVKKNGENSFIELHQDWTFVDEEKFPSVNVWIPLVDANETNGQLRVVKGSHKFDVPIRGRDVVSPFMPLKDLIKEQYMTDLEVAAGNAVIFDERLLHASSDNFSGFTRLAVSVIMVPREATILHYVQDPKDPNRIYKMEVNEDFFTEFGLQDYPVEELGFSEVIHYPYKAFTADEFVKMYDTANPPTSVPISNKY